MANNYLVIFNDNNSVWHFQYVSDPYEITNDYAQVVVDMRNGAVVKTNVWNNNYLFLIDGMAWFIAGQIGEGS